MRAQVRRQRAAVLERVVRARRVRTRRAHAVRFSVVMSATPDTETLVTQLSCGGGRSEPACDAHGHPSTQPLSRLLRSSMRTASLASSPWARPDVLPLEHTDPWHA